MSNFKVFAKSILIPVIAGAVIGFITSSSMDYEMLKQPFLAPPGALFPIVWTALYILMGVSYGILESNNLVKQDVNSIYYTQLVVNLLWSIIFFVFKWRFLAFIWILLLIILVASMVKEFYRKNKIAGLIQIPYLIWLFFAAYLNISIYVLNR